MKGKGDAHQHYTDVMPRSRAPTVECTSEECSWQMRDTQKVPYECATKHASLYECRHMICAVTYQPQDRCRVFRCRTPLEADGLPLEEAQLLAAAAVLHKAHKKALLTASNPRNPAGNLQQRSVRGEPLVYLRGRVGHVRRRSWRATAGAG